jgi:hypothetical protein
MIRTQIQLTEGQARELKELAAREGVSMAELVRHAVNNLLERSGTTSVEERRRRAVALVGQFRSGRSDVSEKHDEYLAEGYGK